MSGYDEGIPMSRNWNQISLEVLNAINKPRIENLGVLTFLNPLPKDYFIQIQVFNLYYLKKEEF